MFEVPGSRLRELSDDIAKWSGMWHELKRWLVEEHSPYEDISPLDVVNKMNQLDGGAELQDWE